ncbi:hypothetical protein CORC01_12419 [Colletotrichum orchidophilum]|uniref:Uncharacterized protein n=1 Tax=Colletotrichum orchidophilum TaxID=1209926 RepID=A0A1G4AT16_9PEZI|nr:uncharacterized protein CORC01_12419 [Colletotrichum orchidophilum]OHE92304.1 hypothetical protein CORC01_12419 [Colletotrichum orchidophilum]
MPSTNSSGRTYIQTLVHRISTRSLYARLSCGIHPRTPNTSRQRLAIRVPHVPPTKANNHIEKKSQATRMDRPQLLSMLSSS